MLPGRLIGVRVDDLRLGAKEGLSCAARMGFSAVELGAAGQVAPEELSQTGRRHLRRYVSDLGLKLAAVGADTGGKGFADRARLEERIEKTCRILELAEQLGVGVVTTSLGPMGAGQEAGERGWVSEALREIGEHADRVGTVVAIETAGQSPEALRGLLRELDCPMLRVCYDPGWLAMEGLDPLAGLEPLAGQIVLSRVRDAVGPSGELPGREVALGQGQVDLPAYLAGLEQAGYDGPQIISRRAGQDPVGEIAAAKARLESMLRSTSR